MSCPDVVSDNPSIDYTAAENQLKSDYASYTIGTITWSTKRGYQIGTFTTTPKSQSQSQSITAWYSVSGTTATREMDSVDLGTTVPASIKAAFEATKYNDALWIIEEIELEHNYNNSGARESYYEMELDGIGANSDLKAELYFSDVSTGEGELLYSKEELDDDDDSDDDKFVINSQLKAAVQKISPDATIIDAEIDDNLIEVEAIITTANSHEEIELKFTMAYEWFSTETKYTYDNFRPELAEKVRAWFTANPTPPAPPISTKVEVTEWKHSETEHNIGDYFFEVEIDDYTVSGTEYEVEFYFNSAMEIIAVIVNDEKQ